MTSTRRPSRRPRVARRAFSLIEVLMAIFILGIGAISIAALFPAGIAQQQQSGDAVMGPIVANNAIEVLRTKLSQSDFGSFEDFSGVFAPRPTVEGDWSWIRPSYIFEPGAENGAIDVFSFDYMNGNSANRSTEFFDGYPGTSSPVLYGAPHNRAKYPDISDLALRRTVTRGERYFPQHSARPQYVWDCMFRRFQGRILVAIFVYRAAQPGGEQAAYAVAPESDVRLSPLPILPPPLGVPGNEAGAWDPYGLDAMPGTADDAFVEGVACDEYDPFDRSHGWQHNGQWILDQNNNIHQVLSAYCEEDGGDDPRIVELVRPVPAMPDIGPYYMLDAITSPLIRGEENVVTDIWYLPLTDGNDVRITPVYVTVKEL